MTEPIPITVQVFDLIGGPLCVSASDGQSLHDKIAPLLRKGTPVVLSFKRVDILIAAFLNAVIGQLYGELAETCRHNGWKLVTNDSDFTSGGIEILTTNSKLLADCP